jgi:hypothetical protein
MLQIEADSRRAISRVRYGYDDEEDDEDHDFGFDHNVDFDVAEAMQQPGLGGGKEF